MTTVRQTVTTVQQSSGHGGAPGLDNSLDALLEDLQSSVARGGGAPAVNGVSAYRREVTRTLERDAPPQVMHLAPANPTTVVAERSASPLLPSMGAVAPGEQRSVSYKTYQYQTYHTAVGGDVRSATLPASPQQAALTTSSVSSATSMGGAGGLGAADAASDARLQQNLHELDSLLVDLRHAQRAGFDPPPPPANAYAHAHTPLGSSTTTTRTEVVTSSGGIDPGLLEPLDHSTPAPPAPPARQPLASTPTQQQVARAVEYKTYRTERQHQHYSDGGGPGPAGVGYGTPMPPPDSPRLQPKRTSSAQRELVYGSEHVSRQRTRSPSPGAGGPQRHEYVEARERYREKSPSHQRLQREVFYNETNTTSSSTSGGTPRAHRYREPSPPPPQQQVQPLRRGPSPGPPQPPGADYPTGSTRTVTTVRTYNYSTGGSGPSPSPAGGQPPSRGRSPSPSPQRAPYRSPSPVSMQQRPAPVDEYTPPRGRSPSPGPGPGQRSPRLNQHTTVHTYTYDGHGGPPVGYHAQPPPSTVTTYKYSTTSSSADRRYPGPGHAPEEQPLLQPRPFPTPSPTPPAGAQPPKRLDDLMASFSDSEHEHPPNSYYRTTTERTVTSSRDGGPTAGQGPHAHHQRGRPSRLLPTGRRDVRAARGGLHADERRRQGEGQVQVRVREQGEEQEQPEPGRRRRARLPAALLRHAVRHHVNPLLRPPPSLALFTALAFCCVPPLLSSSLLQQRSSSGKNQTA
ncbi:hypothetical protein R5R35_005353 [Gryllus longicercus]|uniref:Uncharacterized protein n=1 Tax=Gryllus longicercus TaxID=2509291 RepID=A0AAN9Z1Y1_9ORTH